MKILITAGPTQEYLDPVRFISNPSTGLQGILLAKAAAKFIYNSQVILIIGPTNIELPRYKNIKIINVISADDMYLEVDKYYDECDVAIFSAAVSDYKPIAFSEIKIKKTDEQVPLLLSPNKDIAFEMGKRKVGQINIGFALETNNCLENAISKMERKNFDFIVLNEKTPENEAFKERFNIVSILGKNGLKIDLSKSSKEKIAREILKVIPEEH